MPGCGARLAVEVGVDAGHDLQHGRLAGAVEAEQADLGAREERQRDVLDDLALRRHGLADAVHGVDVLHWRLRRGRRQACAGQGREGVSGWPWIIPELAPVRQLPAIRDGCKSAPAATICAFRHARSRPMFPRDARIEGFDPELAQAIADERQPPGRPHRADRLRELRQPARAGGAGHACSPTSTPKAIRASATTAAASTSTSPSSSRSTACKQLFGADYANVQPHSGSQANQAVYLALLQAGRHHPRHVARARRPPHARRQGQHHRQAFNVVQYGLDATGSDRLRRGASAWRTSTSRS